MRIEAYFHGSPGRLPFVGHFRARMDTPNLKLAVAGSIANRSNVEVAFRAARLLETTLNSVNIEQYADRHDALNAVWARIVELDGCDLGSERGNDLSVLFAVTDQHGTGIAGVGLGGVWAWQSAQLLPLATGDHPLLRPASRPPRLPGILTLDDSHHRFVATPYEQNALIPQLVGLETRCGVHS